MADNRDPPDHPFGNPPITEPGQSADQHDLQSPPPKAEPMEVHHHPHPEHKPRKWKEYFLEFLMISLAVTMGFIGENVREHFTEHKNARILAQSLLEDMQKDTTSLNSLLAFSTRKMNAIDSLLTILHSPPGSWNAVHFYTYMIPMLTSIPFESTDGTYSQMKTSGTLRYFNQSLVNIINAYDVQLKKTKYRDVVEDKGIWILGDLNFNTINLEGISDIRFNKPVTHELYIRLENQQATDKFINLITMNKAFRFRTAQEYKEQLKIAEKLIDALKKEYDLV